MYKTDNGGFAFKCSDIKLMTGASTWGTKLSQFARQQGTMRIITYSLPDVNYINTQLGRRPSDIFLIAHSKFEDRAREIKLKFPDIRVALRDKVHAKVLLVAPKTVYVSSANFGDSGWFESTIGLHSKEAHDWYTDKVFIPLWESCREVTTLNLV